jgi:hypothetical protein
MTSGIWSGRPDPEGPPRVLEVMAAPGPVGGGGVFSIDPERAEECIRTLRAVAVDLMSTRISMDLAYFPPPGTDVVSTNMAVQARVMADRALLFMDTWRSQLEETAAALEEQLAAYLATEEIQRNRLA